MVEWVTGWMAGGKNLECRGGAVGVVNPRVLYHHTYHQVCNLPHWAEGRCTLSDCR